MSIEVERKRFEGWAAKHGYSVEIYKRSDGSYHHSDTEDAWRGWLAHAKEYQGRVVPVSVLEGLCEEWDSTAMTSEARAVLKDLRAIIEKGEV